MRATVETHENSLETPDICIDIVKGSGDLTIRISDKGGRDISTDEPLRHTTPIFGRAAITYQKSRLRTEFYTEYNSDRDPDQIPPSEFDRKPYLYTEEGTPAWYTLNVRTAYRVSDNIKVNIALENILDKHYRPYTSGISAPGRNLLISLKANI